MKVVIHDLGDEITYTLGKADEDSGVIHADNQYASCRDCFKCWLKNAGFCIMKGFSAERSSARVIHRLASADAVTENTAVLLKPFWTVRLGVLFRFSPSGADKPIISTAIRAGS